MLRWKIRTSLFLILKTSGRWLGTARKFFELLIGESPHVLFLQEARTTPHELRAMKHRFLEVGYFVLWDTRRQFDYTARHGLNLCQIRGPECVERYKLGYYALQLRDTRVLLRSVHCTHEDRLKGPNLRRNWNVLPLPVVGDSNSQLCWRTGDHVLMPNVRSWRKNAGSPSFVSCVDGGLSNCSRGLADISALEPVSGVQHRPVKLVIHVKPLTSCCYKWVRGKHFPWGLKLGSKLDGSPS